jgi:hypothetical protein
MQEQSQMSVGMFFAFCSCTIVGYSLFNVGISAELIGEFSLYPTANHLGFVWAQLFIYSAVLLAVLYAGTALFICLPNRATIRRLASWSLFIVCVISVLSDIPMIFQHYLQCSSRGCFKLLSERGSYTWIYIISLLLISYGNEATWKYLAELDEKSEPSAGSNG